MKKLVLLVALIVGQFASNAQVQTPQLSPKASLSQKVGLTDVAVEYSRPSARGRNVFGDLVPFGKVWRTGANANTTVSFSEDVNINGVTLKKGKYALYTTPKVDAWEVIFYSKSDNWGTPETWNDADIALKTTVKPEMTNRKTETFTIGINAIDPNFAFLELSWDKTLVALKFEVPTQKMAMASIEKVLAGPAAGDFYASAQYYFQSNGDTIKALEYVNKAIDLSKEKPYWYTRLKSLIQAKNGDKKGAIETAKISLAAATAANNGDYIKMNQDSIAEWGKK